jgi:transposase
MVAPLARRPLHDSEAEGLRTLAHGQQGEARRRARARSCWLAHAGQRVTAIRTAVGGGHRTVRRWIHRVTTAGVAGLPDAPR